MAAAAIKILTVSVVAAAALAQYRAVTNAGVLPAAGARSLGFTDTIAAVGERVSVGVLGTTIAEAGAAFVAGDALEVDAAGRVIAKAAGVVVARAMQPAAAAGQLVEVLLIPN